MWIINDKSYDIILTMILDKILMLGIFSGILQFIGYCVYAYDVSRDAVKPNPASWLIWSYGNILICLSYIFLVNNSLTFAAEILPIVCSITCVVMAIYFMFIGKFRPLISFEKKIIFFDILLTLIWVSSEFIGFNILPTAVIHILLLLGAAVTFIPIYKEVFDDPSVEHPRAWFIWFFAYVVLFAVVFTEGGSFDALLYPALYSVLHVIVGILAYKKLL
ncbi:MAG: hypothetical protein QG654_506 [Patescibacteria group bacterium]|jgi:hypothetical protein|nr:hypothetical protein [Patescibacteria group bacterium]